jgi:PAS domain S-box-containing protein
MERVGQSERAERNDPPSSPPTAPITPEPTSRELVAALDVVGERILILDGEQRIRYCNEASCIHLGRSRSDIVGRHCCEVYHGVSEPLVACPMVRMQKTQLRQCIQRLENGRWFEITVDPLPNGSPHSNGAVHTTRDITASKLIEKQLLTTNSELDEEVLTRTVALAESEERFRAIFEGAADGILLVDPHTHALHDANSAMLEMLGYEQDQLRDLTSENLHPEEAQAAVAEHIEEQINGNNRLAESVPMLRRDGSCFYADVNAFPLTINGTQLLAGIFRDMTTRKEAQELLSAQAERLRRLAVMLASAQDDEQRRIAEGLHDDVAQLLAACGVNISLAAQTPHTEDADGLLKATNHLLRQAGTKLSTLSFELSSSTLYRLGIYEALDELCQAMSKRYHVHFDLDGSSDHPSLDEATGTILFKAARELLFNVVKHAEATQASVSVIASETMVELAVEDNGQGFFEGAGNEEINAGLGLGLFGIRERLRDLGGDIDIESIPHVQTRVTLTVPRTSKN